MFIQVTPIKSTKPVIYNIHQISSVHPLAEGDGCYIRIQGLREFEIKDSYKSIVELLSKHRLILDSED